MRSEGYRRALDAYVGSNYDPALFQPVRDAITADNVVVSCEYTRRQVLQDFVGNVVPQADVIWLLSTYGNIIYLEHVDHGGYTALMLTAAAPYDVHNMRILLLLGADTHYINRRNERAIDILLSDNGVITECVSLLIEAGSPLPLQPYDEVTNMYNHRRNRRRRCRLTAAAVLSKVGKGCCVLSSDMRRMIAQYVWSSQGRVEWLDEIELKKRG